MAVDRGFVDRLIREYVPEKGGLVYNRKFENSDARHNEIINRFKLPDGTTYREYRDMGTTCGYLCQWLLFRIGLKDPALLNRATFRADVQPNNGDFDDFKHMDIYGFTLKGKKVGRHGTVPSKPANDSIHFQTFFDIGLNLSKIRFYPSFKLVGPKNFDDLNTLMVGDICLIGGEYKDKIDKDGNTSKVDNSHVFLILEKSAVNPQKSISFKTVEAGQNSSGSGKDVIHKVRKFNLGKDAIVTEIDGRKFVGFLSLDTLPIIAPIEKLETKDLYDPFRANAYYNRNNISTITPVPRRHC